MRSHLFALLLFANGLMLGVIFGWQLRTPPAPAVHATDTLRYEVLADEERRLVIFDQVTGLHTSFLQLDGLWFVMTYDPSAGSVHYRRTELIEDPEFLKAAREIRTQLPGRLPSP